MYVGTKPMNYVDIACMYVPAYVHTFNDLPDAKQFRSFWFARTG
jgi:hypothetical protein